MYFCIGLLVFFLKNVFKDVLKMYLNTSFFLKDRFNLFERQSYIQREREVGCVIFHTQMLATTGPGPGQNPQPGIHFGSPPWMTETQLLEEAPAAPQGRHSQEAAAEPG